MSTHDAGTGCDGMPISDRDLARRCQQGEPAAYTELVSRHRAAVRGIAYAILSCAEDAEDVVQESFVRAYEAVEQYNGRHEFGAWIRRITVNCAIGKLREQERRGRLARQHGRTSPPALDPPEHAARNELKARVHRAIGRLPIKQRLAVTLFGLQDMSLAEVAQAMGCSVGAVKQHLHRGRRRLGELLPGDLEEE